MFNLSVVAFAYLFIFQLIIAGDRTELMKDIEELANLVDVDNVFDVIKTEMQSLYPNAIAFNKDKYPDNEYQFDESIDCAFNLFDLTDYIKDLMLIIANKLELTYDQTIHQTLFQAIESTIYILCDNEYDETNIDDVDGFVEWIIMRDKKKRADIESIIVNKMKTAFKITLSDKAQKEIAKEKHGEVLYKKCLTKLKKKKIRKLYQKLREKYPKQKYMLDMIFGIFMYSCARKYATPESIQQFMKELVSMDDADVFFNYLSDNMKPYLDSSNDNDNCLEQTSELTYLLEIFILKNHSEFKKYPVFNAMNGLIELGCAKKFVFDDDTLPSLDDIRNRLNDINVIHTEL
eukprot:286680_1